MNIIESFLTKNDCWTANVNRTDYRYRNFQDNGPQGLMLHSTGCAQPDAQVFVNNWNRPGVQKMVHAFIDANTGDVRHTNKWNYRSWHCAGSGNNTHIGVEMCESGYIRYTSGIKFEVLDRTRAVADCVRTYHAAVELFAYLCKMWNLDPLTKICSHKEGYAMGIASGHQDPEHYWKGLGMPYTMDGFRTDVKNKMEEEEIDMTLEQLNELIDAKITERIGRQITHLSDIPWEGVRNEFSVLLEDEFIDGGTDKDVDPTDIRLPLSEVRAILIAKRYADAKIRALLEEPDCEDCRIHFDGEE